MAIVHNEYSFPSASKLGDIYAQSWAPKLKRDAKAVMILCHGMAEHSDRYADFATFFAKNGVAVFAEDHIGHGKSARSESDLGYFGQNDEECKVFVEDMRSLMKIAQKNHLDVPVFIFGHSMGSFITRKFIATYGNDLAGAIICGTAGTNPAVDVALKMTDTIIKKKGPRDYSKVLSAMSFAGYNAKTEKRTDFDWLSRCQDVVDKYIADPKCGFLFTAQGMRDLYTLLKYVNSEDCYRDAPKSLPIFIIAGSMDPVGSYGKGPEEVYDKYLKSGHNAQLKLYQFARHEIHNEMHRDETYNDVLDFILNNVPEE